MVRVWPARTRQADADGGEEDGADAGEEKDDSDTHARRAQQLLAVAHGAACDDERRVAAHHEQVRPRGGDACVWAKEGARTKHSARRRVQKPVREFPSAHLRRAHTRALPHR
jgi:hypothetical protein